MKKLQMLKVAPKLVEDSILPKIEISVVALESKGEEFESREMLDFYYKEIECDLIDVATFGNPYEKNHFSVIVDDEGLLKSGNVAMALLLPIEGETLTLELCGTLLFSKSELIEGEGLVEVGLTEEEIQYVIENLGIKIIGITN